MDAELVYTRNVSHLAARISRECMLPIFGSNVRIFSNHEMSVSVSKSFQNVVVLASTINNDDWLELFLLLDALKTAKNILLCMPYCGYARQDHHIGNESCGSDLTLHFIENFNNVTQCVFIDRHHFPNTHIPSVQLHAGTVFADDIQDKLNNITIVSPDFGGMDRAKNVADILQAPLVICNKHKNMLGKVKKIDVIGNVKDKNCVLIDDIVDSGATVCAAANELMDQGANNVYAYVTHGLFNEHSIENIEKSPINELVFTDSLPLKNNLSEKFRVVSVSSLIISAIRSKIPQFKF